MSNSIDPDETAHNEPSHLDLRCLQKPIIIAYDKERAKIYKGGYAERDTVNKHRFLRHWKKKWIETRNATRYNGTFAMINMRLDKKKKKKKKKKLQQGNRQQKQQTSFTISKLSP